MSITVGTIVGGIVAVAKAVPAARDIVNTVQAQLLKWELSRITDEYTEKQKLVDALVTSISRAKTREERRALSKVMSRYTSGSY